MELQGKLLGIDFGERRMGLATSDISQLIATGYLTLDTKKNKDIFGTLNNIITEQNIVGVVVGYPERTDAQPGEKARTVDHFIKNLSRMISQPIYKQDESYSTVRAGEILRSRKRKQKRKEGKGIIDKVAASIILQDFLDNRKATL